MGQKQSIVVGGASGYWGESDMAVPQFLAQGGLDYIVFDYLAEITLSIMARARAKDPQAGYATDFVSAVIKPHAKTIARQGVKLIANAGGVNPIACGKAVEAVLADAGVDLKVAVITGDDLMDRAAAMAETGVTEMFSGAPFPALDRLASINAYLGAFPIARALDEGADIVITGRVVDSAVTLGACLHEFDWAGDDYDRLAAGALAGHLLECGPQATGGNFTDWRQVADDLDNVGYPIAHISRDGSMEITKPDGTGGLVSIGTVAEQMLYEIGDPQTYLLPDVTCDFSDVTITETGDNRVKVAGAKGRPATADYKVSATWHDGWRAGTLVNFYGEDASEKARMFADNAVKRARAKLRAVNAPDYDEVAIEVLGDESHYGAHAKVNASREVVVKLAARHRSDKAVGLLLREISGIGLASPPGLSIFAGGRPKPSPVLRLFSCLVPKAEVPITLNIDGQQIDLGTGTIHGEPQPPSRPVPPALPDHDPTSLTPIPLIDLAWARSGDKGDKANIGVIPRHLIYAPWIWAALTETEVSARFAHFLKGGVERWYMPGTGAINFLLHDVLGGGGVASLRNDPQGKGYSQILLQTPIPIPPDLLEAR